MHGDDVRKRDVIVSADTLYVMERYKYLETISSGAYGVCYKVLDTTTGQHCAAKGIKQAHEDAEVMRLTLREVKILKTLPPHVNIVRLLEAFRSHSGRVYLVFEYVDRSLYQELERHPSGALPGPMVKSVAWQLLHALGHCHDHGVMHRDVKPANVLLTGYIPGVGSGGVVKLCDFGFARTVPSGGGSGRMGATRLSSYVMTRWYRPPEVLVGDTYGIPIDVWSYGCTLAELATGRPLFPGRSTVDQLWRIMRCLGPLSMVQTACMRRDVRLQAVWTPPERLKTLRQRLPDLDPRLYEVVSACLTMDPNRRPTVHQLLQMPYFWDVRSMLANTDLARQLPYAVDMTCTIKFRPSMSVAANTAAVKQGVAASSALSRIDGILGSCPQGSGTAIVTAMSNPSTTSTTEPVVEPLTLKQQLVKVPPLASAGPEAAMTAVTKSVIQVADRAGDEYGVCIRSPHTNQERVANRLKPPTASSPPPPEPHQPTVVDVGAVAAVHDEPCDAEQESSCMATLPVVSPAAAQMAAATADRGLNSSTVATEAVDAKSGEKLEAASAATDSVALALRGLAMQVAAAATAAKVATAASTATAAIQAAATAAAAAAAANAAAAAAARAAVTAATTLANGTSGTTSFSPPDLLPSPPSLLLHSTVAPGAPLRGRAISVAPADQGGMEAAAIAASGTLATAPTADVLAAPSGTGPESAQEGGPMRAQTPATADIRVLNASCLYEALSRNGRSAAPPRGLGTVFACVSAVSDTSDDSHHMNNAPAASAHGGKSSTDVAEASSMGEILGDGGLRVCGRRSLQYQARSGMVGPYPGEDLTPPAMNASGTDAAAKGESGRLVVYSPIVEPANGGGPQGPLRIVRPTAAAAAVAAAAAATVRPSDSRGCLQLTTATRRIAGGSTGGAPVGAGGMPLAGVLTGSSSGPSAVRRLQVIEPLAASSTSGADPSPVIAGVGFNSGPRFVDPKYDSLGRFARDSQDMLLTSELKYIGSPSGAPGLCQFITPGAQLPHRRGPPLPPTFLFLSSPSDTHGSLQLPESATGGVGAANSMTAEVALPSGPIPGCTFDLDLYQPTADHPTEVYDSQHLNPFETSSPGHPSVRQPSKLWGWALSSLRLAGGFDATPQAPQMQLTCQQLNTQQHVAHQQQQYAQQLPQQQHQQVAPNGFARTMKWLGSHGGGGGGMSRHDVLDTAPSYTAIAYGGASAGGSCTMGSVLGTGGSACVAAIETTGLSTPEGYGNGCAKSGALITHLGGSCNSQSRAGGGKCVQREKSLSSTRSLPGCLFGPLHRGSATIRADNGDVKSILLPPPGDNLKQTRSQQVTSTMSSACLPAVEGPRPEAAWVSSDINAGGAGLRNLPAAAVGSAHELFPSFGTAAALATAQQEQVAAAAPNLVQLISVAAAPGFAATSCSTASAAGAPPGNGSSSTSPGTTPTTHVADAEAIAAAGSDSRGVARKRVEQNLLMQGIQPLYSRPLGGKLAMGVSKTTQPSVGAPAVQQQQGVISSPSRQTAAPALRRISKTTQRSSSTPASRSGSSRLGSRSFPNSGALVAAAAAAQDEIKPNGGCLPVAFAASAALMSIFSFRATLPKSSRSRGAVGAGDNSNGSGSGAAGGGGGSSYVTISRSGSVRNGSRSGVGGGVDMLPCRLSIGKSGLRTLSDEKRSPMTSLNNTAATVTASGNSAGGVGGRQKSVMVGGVEYNVVCMDGNSSAIIVSCAEDDSTHKAGLHGATYLSRTRSSMNMPCYNKASATSSGLLGTSRSSGDMSASLQSAAVGGGSVGFGGGGGGGPGSSCFDPFFHPPTVGPTILESEEGAAPRSSSADRTHSSMKAATSYCHPSAALIPTVCGPGAAAAAAVNATPCTTSPSPCLAQQFTNTATTATGPATATPSACGSVDASWRLSGAPASASLAEMSSIVRKSKMAGTGAITAARSRTATEYDGRHPSTAMSSLGTPCNGRRASTGAGAGAGAGGPSMDGCSSAAAGHTAELADEENMASGWSASTKASGSVRARLRSLKARVRQLLFGTS